MGASGGLSVAGKPQDPSLGLAINSGGQAISGLVGAFTAANATKQAAALDQQIYEMNAQLAELQGADAIRRGEVEAQDKAERTRQLKGSQRVALAAQGIDIDSGTAGQIIADTEILGAREVETIRNNAWRESFGYKVDALNSRTKGSVGMVKATNEARSTVLTGGMKAVTKAAQSYGYATGRSWAKDL